MIGGAGVEFAWCDESRGSIEAFAGYFGAKLNEYEFTADGERA